jgi:hypothetical protein
VRGRRKTLLKVYPARSLDDNPFIHHFGGVIVEREVENVWKTLPSWAVVATGDKATGSDVIRSMAQRAEATITEVEGSHVIMLSQLQVVMGMILTAVAVSEAGGRP